MSQRRTYRELPNLELALELNARIWRMTEQADRDVAEARINVRWGTPQLATVKRAAALLGVPCQTYLKQVVLKQASRDIREAEALVDRL